MRPVLDPARPSAPADELAAFRSDGVTAQNGLRIPFFTESFGRAYGFPETRLVNLLTEPAPVREERPYTAFVGLREVRYSRPGLAAGVNYGAGPVRCAFMAPPLLGGFKVIVSGGTAYNADSGASLGSIGGTDMVRFAVSRLQMVLVAAGVAYVSTGGAFAPIASAVIGPVSDVAYLSGRFVYAMAGSDTFYWSEINDPANIGGLSFATAESFPDAIVGLGVLGDELLIFGASSVETWSVSGDANAPFTPVLGKGYQRGCAARDATAFVDNALVWIGDNRVVYATRTAPARISHSGVEDKLRQCANISACTAFTATFEGHELYVLNIPGVGSYAYDASRAGQGGPMANASERGEWSEWSSWGRTGFQGRCSVYAGGVTWVGDDTSNDLWKMQFGVYKDGAAPLVRTASAFIKVEEGFPVCRNLLLHCVMGVGNVVDPASNPVAEMRYSDDQGRTFSDWRQAPLGKQGSYRLRASWQRLGQMRAPGRLIEVRIADAVNAALSHIEFNSGNVVA